jgi:hypothetical protein
MELLAYFIIGRYQAGREETTVAAEPFLKEPNNLISAEFSRRFNTSNRVLVDELGLKP